MKHGAIAHEVAKTGRWAISLASLLVALWPVTACSAEEVAEPRLMVPEQLAPESIVNALRHFVGATDGSPQGSLPAPPLSNEEAVIPIQPRDDKDLEIQDDRGQISLKVRDASLRQVIALIAETQKLNLVFAAPEDRAITASFDRVPWQQVFDSLLTSTGHTWITNDGVIMVTRIDDADLISPGASGRHVEVFDLDFVSAVDVDQTVKVMLSPAGKSFLVETDSADNRRTREAIAVLDYPDNRRQIAEYISLADQPPRQVLIEAHIMQIDLACDCRSGVNFDALATSASGNELNFRTVGFANPAATTAFFLEATGGAIETLVELLQTTTDAKTLASPKVLVVSGQQARMQVGEQLGFRVVTTTQTSTLEEVQFLDVGVVLTVTPRVTRDGRVLMRIKPEVSTGQVDPETGLPSEETTEVETDIMLTDGHGMVIGGLIQEQDSNIQSKIPWLGDLPYVGILFQKRKVERSRTEIIVTLVPHIQPYTPIVAEREDHQLMKTLEPLTVGPLDRFQRPYEAQLPDTFTNPRRPLTSLLHRLPPVEERPNHRPSALRPTSTLR